MLRLAYPNASDRQLFGLSVGARDRLLLDLHDDMFGADLELRGVCPSCGEELEIIASTDEFRVAFDGDGAMYELTADDHAVRFRLPTSADVQDASTSASADARRRELWQSCVVVHLGGVAVAVDDVPLHVAAAVEAHMGEIDSQAVSVLECDCPVCAHHWAADFDIVPIMWSLLDGEVRRRLHDVHRLAEGYGWEESTVLGLSSTRRNFYLELLS